MASESIVTLTEDNFEAEVIKRSLQQHQGNIKAVMDALDLPRRTLNQKMASKQILHILGARALFQACGGSQVLSVS